MTAEDANSELLDTALNEECYGIFTYPAMNDKSTDVSLAQTHKGVVVTKVGVIIL